MRTVSRGGLCALAAVSLAACSATSLRTVAGNTTSSRGPSTTTAPNASSRVRPGPPPGGRPRTGTSTTSAGHVATTGPASTGGGGSSSAVLAADGVGQARIGAAAVTPIASTTQSLGKPTRDLAKPGQVCQGPDRIVTWGRLTLTFTGGVLKGWVYELSPAGPPALTTAAGVTTGTTVTKLREVYGARLTVYPPEPSFDASFEVDGGRALRGFLTSEAATGKVTSMGVGLGCAE